MVMALVAVCLTTCLVAYYISSTTYSAQSSFHFGGHSSTSGDTGGGGGSAAAVRTPTAQHQALQGAAQQGAATQQGPSNGIESVGSMATDPTIGDPDTLPSGNASAGGPPARLKYPIWWHAPIWSGTGYSSGGAAAVNGGTATWNSAQPLLFHARSRPSFSSGGTAALELLSARPQSAEGTTLPAAATLPAV